MKSSAGGGLIEVRFAEGKTVFIEIASISRTTAARVVYCIWLSVVRELSVRFAAKKFY